jgi:hypothetical protein
METPSNVQVSYVELSEAELSEVAAGKFKDFVNFDDIKRESNEKGHRDW